MYALSRYLNSVNCHRSRLNINRICLHRQSARRCCHYEIIIYLKKKQIVPIPFKRLIYGDVPKLPIQRADRYWKNPITKKKKITSTFLDPYYFFDYYYCFYSVHCTYHF